MFRSKTLLHCRLECFRSKAFYFNVGFFRSKTCSTSLLLRMFQVKDILFQVKNMLYFIVGMFKVKVLYFIVGMFQIKDTLYFVVEMFQIKDTLLLKCLRSKTCSTSSLFEMFQVKDMLYFIVDLFQVKDALYFIV